MIADPATAINGSVVNLWEMQITSRLGKPDLTMPLGAIHDWIVNQEGWALLPVCWPHIRRLAVLACPYKDPFDRLLIAQALGKLWATRVSAAAESTNPPKSTFLS